ncbi:DNA alkylation repair protein [Streptococcus pneumoniae]|nr:DNA alkylation repair protein [Streptococcus pneumoniae]
MTDFHDFKFIFFENLFKPRQLYLQSQNSVLSNLWLAS